MRPAEKLNLGPKPDIIDKSTKASLNKFRQVDRGVVSSWIDRVIKKANTEVPTRWPPSNTPRRLPALPMPQTLVMWRHGWRRGRLHHAGGTMPLWSAGVE